MHRYFEWIIEVIIVLNAVYMGIETHFARDVEESAVLPMPWYVLDMIFVVIFSMEVLVRLYVEQLKFFSTGWNCFDFSIVFIAAVESAIMTFISGPVKWLHLVTLLRVFRILRLLRIIRLLRFHQELRLLVVGIIPAVRTLFWAWVLIVLLCYIGSIFFTRVVGHEAPNDDVVQELFGTVGRTFFTLFQVLTVDDWVDIVNVAETVAWYSRPIFAAFVIMATFAVLNVVVAIIVEKTLENSMRHREAALKDATASTHKSKEMIEKIFKMADEDCSGELTKTEFMTAMANPDVMRFLHEVGVDLRRADSLFDVLDYDESGVLDIDEFVAGVLDARGEARSKDVLELHCDLWRWEQSIKKDLEEFRSDTENSVNLFLDEVGTIKAAVGRLRDSITPMLHMAH